MSPMCCLIKGAVGQHLSCSRRSGLSSCLWITLCIPNVASYWFGSLVRIIWCFFLLAIYSILILFESFQVRCSVIWRRCESPDAFCSLICMILLFYISILFHTIAHCVGSGACCFCLWWLSSLWYRLLTKLRHFFLAQTRFDCRLISSTARMKITSRTVPLLVLPSL